MIHALPSPGLGPSPARRGWLALGLALALLSLPGPATAEAASGDGSASAMIRATTERVLAVLHATDISSDERRQRIEEIVYAQFDFETVHRLVLGRYWRTFSDAQRRAFAEEFRRHLVLNYGDRIDRYNQEALEVLGERPEARGDITVRTRVAGGNADGFGVDYRMRKRDGEWLVIDVVIEGVSVLKSYRSQFGEILARSSPQGLIDQLQAKNAAKARETPPPGENAPMPARADGSPTT